MYKIGVIELKCSHHEVANLCKIANPKKNDVTLFTTEELLTNIEEQLEEYRKFITFCVKKKDESYLKFIKKINKTCSINYNLVIINTVSRWEMIYLRLNCYKISYFYSLKFWFYDSYQKIRLEDIKGSLDYLNLLSWLPSRLHANPFFGNAIRKNILKKIDGVLVEYPTFRELLTDSYGYKNPVYFLPKSHFEESNNYPLNKQLTFVVTGTISISRRDYDSIFDALLGIPNDIRSKVKLVLLGKPIGKYGAHIISRCDQLNNDGFDIEYSKTFITVDKFKDKLSNSDIIISPMNLVYESGTIVEKFTYTKGTGTFNDAIKFGKPSIVPKKYNVAPQFDSCFIKYQDISHLTNIITDLIKCPEKLTAIKSKTKEIMSNYKLYNIQKSFDLIITNILNSRNLGQKNK